MIIVENMFLSYHCFSIFVYNIYELQLMQIFNPNDSSKMNSVKLKLIPFLAIILVSLTLSCKQNEKPSDMNIIFLHHSTGNVIWNGTKPSLIGKAIRRANTRIAEMLGVKAHLPYLIDKYNKSNNKNYHIKEFEFPKRSPYGWNNYPYDYYNIWVKNAGEMPYKEEPTLEMLTKEYQVIIFKHCYPGSNIQEDLDSVDINSDIKTLANYKLQYIALRDKLHQFPDTKFILLTGAAQVASQINLDEAKRAKQFLQWVINEWDMPEDNIFLWDLRTLQTEGDLYFKEEYARSNEDSHPNKQFAGRVVKLFSNRIIDIIENNGTMTKLTGEKE